MKQILSLLLLLSFLTLNANAQRVETLVEGPSTFDDGLAVDSAGNIYASRYYGSTITKISPSGETAIFTSGLESPNAIAFDSNGNLLVPNATGGKVHRVSKNGSKEVILSNIFNPTGVAVDSIGNIYVSQYQSSKIVKLDTSGNLSTYLSGGLLDGPVSMIFDDEGDLFIGNFDDGKILKYSSDSTLSVVGSVPGWLGSFTMVDSTIYATAIQRNKIYRISKDGSSQDIFAGTGSKGNKDGPLLKATFNSPNGITASNSGDTLFISDFETRSLRMITGIIPNNPKINISDTLDFGEVNINTDQIFEKSLVIENNGNDTLRIQKFIFADSVFHSQTETLNIPPYSLDSLKVRFTPSEVEDVSSTLEIHSNAGTEIDTIVLLAKALSSTRSEIQNEVPRKVKLYPNYPNPFNPVTKVSIDLPESANISLKVYDVQGRLVATLHEGRLSSGSHTFSFDASSLSSGHYFGRVELEGVSETIKMSLIK